MCFVPQRSQAKFASLTPLAAKQVATDENCSMTESTTKGRIQKSIKFQFEYLHYHFPRRQWMPWWKRLHRQRRWEHPQGWGSHLPHHDLIDLQSAPCYRGGPWVPIQLRPWSVGWFHIHNCYVGEAIVYGQWRPEFGLPDLRHLAHTKRIPHRFLSRICSIHIMSNISARLHPMAWNRM